MKRLDLLAQMAGQVRRDAFGRPTHSTQLPLLLPIFQYRNIGLEVRDPVIEMAEHNYVSLHFDSEFLIPASRVVASSSATATTTAATPAQQTNQENIHVHGQRHGLDSGRGTMEGIQGFPDGNINIFDTSDILNTTLLDGTLWPGQL